MIYQHPIRLTEVRARIADVLNTHIDTIDTFHKLFYDQPFTWGMTRYRGVPVLKNPCDLWTYQEVIHDTQPTLILETGTACGGSALWFADMLTLQGSAGRVVTIDIAPTGTPPHPRITYVRGGSTDPAIVAEMTALAQHERVMVVLDSAHETDHVAAELNAYGPLVSPGCYLCVEDTNLAENGPLQAVLPWLAAHPEFYAEILGERYLLTFQPRGWLQRIAA